MIVDAFELPVTYKSKELLLPSLFLQPGYARYFQVEENGLKLLFEPDEERKYRGVIDPERIDSNKINQKLLKAIVNEIEGIAKQMIHYLFIIPIHRLI